MEDLSVVVAKSCGSLAPGGLIPRSAADKRGGNLP